MLGKFFYIIYNYYYSGGANGKGVPAVSAGGIFGTILVCLGMLSHSCYFAIVDVTSNEPLNREGLFIVLCAYAILYYLFVVKNRKYIEIYNLYKEDQFLNSKKARVLAWSTIILVMFSPFVFEVLRHKIVFG